MQSLLGRLVRVQAWVVALSCMTLVLGVLVGSAVVLRSTQDTTLRSIREELCRGIVLEMAQQHRTPRCLAGVLHGGAMELVRERSSTRADRSSPGPAPTQICR